LKHYYSLNRAECQFYVVVETHVIYVVAAAAAAVAVAVVV